MINSITRPEILAPCGSYEILIAAVRAGANACYIGGNRFSARAYAANLMEDEVARAIDYAHLHDTKLYLTVNTLLKNNEIRELVDYIKPYYEAGLDAAIVQDLGVFSVLKNYFPKLPLHCSTQMNINSVHAAAMMKEQGAARVVTAREMCLDEIRLIKEKVDIEIETFVHGAMCYSYSGQCLMSSLAGGRSGNRGRCAQPCRKCYDNQYILSMKDLCSLTKIPELLAAGIDSLKIEGRMKNAYYVASAVDAYREIVNDVVNDCFDISKAQEYQKKLADIFNRGGFTEGYFFRHNGQNMISKNRPNNQGTYIGDISKIADGKVFITTCEKLYKGDVLELPLKDFGFVEITSPNAYEAGETAILAAPKTRLVAGYAKVYRTRCNERLAEIEHTILNAKKIQPLTFRFKAKVGERLALSVLDSHSGHWVTIEDDIVERSNNRRSDTIQMKAKISQLGDTDYTMQDLLLDTDEDAFVPMSKVKHMRRAVIEQYEQAVCKRYQRDGSDIQFKDCDFANSNDCSVNGYMAFVQTKEQLQAVLENDFIKSICMDAKLFETCYKTITKAGAKDIYISLPYIIDSHFDIEAYLPKTSIRGIYIRNIDGFACVYKSYKMNKLSKDLVLIGAFSLYSYNDYAMEFWKKLLPDMIFEAGYELNSKELTEFTNKPSAALLYGHQQVMLSAQCINKSKGTCNHSFDTIKITDDKANPFYAKCMCEQCFNVIYNGRVYCMIDKEQELADTLQAKLFMLSFTIEDYDETNNILRAIYDKSMIQQSAKLFTYGHFYRGVE